MLSAVPLVVFQNISPNKTAASLKARLSGLSQNISEHNQIEDNICTTRTFALVSAEQGLPRWRMGASGCQAGRSQLARALVGPESVRVCTTWVFRAWRGDGKERRGRIYAAAWLKQLKRQS